ncbi:MAG: hypothetical protein HFF18_00050 [Oscillospiraceae bacterium]|nr:hypothetical protein [Oscillospiraceae bacterium]
MRNAKQRKDSNSVLHRFCRHKLAVAGAVFILLLCLCAIFAPVLAPFDPNNITPDFVYAHSPQYTGCDFGERNLRRCQLHHAGILSELSEPWGGAAHRFLGKYADGCPVAERAQGHALALGPAGRGHSADRAVLQLCGGRTAGCPRPQTHQLNRSGVHEPSRQDRPEGYGRYGAARGSAGGAYRPQPAGH